MPHHRLLLAVQIRVPKVKASRHTEEYRIGEASRRVQEY